MRRALFFMLGALGVLQVEAQMQWLPTEMSVTSGLWLAEGDMKEVVDGPAIGGYLGWMTRATNGWAVSFGGVEHGGFVGIHQIGSTPYGFQPQAGWTLRTGLTRLVGWSFTGGVAYNPHIYNAESAPELVAVGSNWNGLVRLGMTVANNSQVSVGLGILHTSNGALKRPNKGINTPQAKVVVRVGKTPTRRVLLDAALPRTWRSLAGLALGGRDHGGFGGHLYGIQELFAQSSYVWSAKYALTGQISMVHHGALRADPSTDAPSDTIATSIFDRLQPGLAMGWTWMFGRARLDILKGGVLLNPTPGFLHGFNKAQLAMKLHPDLDGFVALRWTDWRADYVSIGLALRWGSSEEECLTCPNWQK